jgi:hypothetical protein
MADLRLRTLERDPDLDLEGESALLRARLREGSLVEQGVRRAAALGHGPARRLLAREAPPLLVGFGTTCGAVAKWGTSEAAHVLIAVFRISLPWFEDLPEAARSRALAQVRRALDVLEGTNLEEKPWEHLEASGSLQGEVGLDGWRLQISCLAIIACHWGRSESDPSEQDRMYVLGHVLRCFHDEILVSVGEGRVIQRMRSMLPRALAFEPFEGASRPWREGVLELRPRRAYALLERLTQDVLKERPPSEDCPASRAIRLANGARERGARDGAGALAEKAAQEALHVGFRESICCYSVPREDVADALAGSCAKVKLGLLAPAEGLQAALCLLCERETMRASLDIVRDALLPRLLNRKAVAPRQLPLPVNESAAS